MINNFHIPKNKNNDILKSLNQQIVYSAADYGINSNNCGKDVKVAILDSGYSKHDDIKKPVDMINFLGDNKKIQDTHGHSTIISGILAANNDKIIKGLAYNADLYCVKVIDFSGNGNFNAVVSGILWSIVKDVDIILMAFGTNTDYPILEDAVKKANDIGICVMAAAGNNKINEKDDFPARYPYVLSCKKELNNKAKKNIYNKDNNTINIVYPYKDIITTYKNNKYIRVDGTSIAAVLAAGLVANIIGEIKETKKHFKNKTFPKLIFDSLGSLVYNPKKIQGS